MKKALQIILGLLILIGISISVWFGVKEIAVYLKSTNSTLIAAMITASATIFVGLGAVLISQDRIKKREIEEAHRESKIELYKRFNEFLFKLLSGANELVGFPKNSTS